MVSDHTALAGATRQVLLLHNFWWCFRFTHQIYIKVQTEIELEEAFNFNFHYSQYPNM